MPQRLRRRCFELGPDNKVSTSYFGEMVGYITFAHVDPTKTQS